MQQPRKHRQGFTLIEFLVVTAIVVMGAALFAPAVQQSRAQARQRQCYNNLKSLGVALHNYHDTHAVFPPAWVAKVPTAGDSPRYGWMSFLLPYADHAPMYNAIASLGKDRGFEKPLPAADFDHEGTRSKIFQTKIEVYRCPADTTADANPMRGGYGTSNYSGNHGDASLPRWTTGRQTALWPGQADTPKKANGILYWNSSTRIRDITDGTTNTFLVGERSVTSAAGIWPGVGSNNFENDASTECSHGSRLNAGPTSFSSGHPGGANFLTCDGAVHFINNKIDSQPTSAETLGTYQRLANRHDGLIVGDFASED